MCPLPDALDHKTARLEVGKVRKEMPGLTTAAHRREAARRLGVDYNTFLAAWKRPGATTTPVSTPTTATSVRKLAPSPKPTSTVTKVSAKDPHPVYGQKIMRGDEHVGYIRQSTVTEHHMVKGTRYASGKSTKKVWDIYDANGGKIGFGQHRTRKQALDAFERKHPRPSTPPTPAVKAPKPEPTPTPTANTGLSHTSARNAYNQARKNNPNGTPAKWRREAAENMGLDYKTYMTHWKKPNKGDMLPATDPPKVPKKATAASERKVEDQIQKLLKQASDSQIPHTRLGYGWEKRFEDVLRTMARNNPRAFLRIRKFKWENTVGTNGSYHMITGEIRMHWRLLMRAGAEDAYRAQRSRWHVPRKSHTHPEPGHGTMTHEMGHVIHGMLSHEQEVALYQRIADILGLRRPPGYMVGHDLTVVEARVGVVRVGHPIQSYQYQAGLDLDAWFEKNFKRNPDIDAGDFAQEYLSTYGLSNRMEMLAEIYAEYKTQGDKARELARVVGQMMEDFIA